MTQVILTYSAPFASLAEGEARRIGLTPQQRLTPGVLLADTQASFDQLASQLRKRPPVYFRHLHPVQNRPPKAPQTLRYPSPLLSQPFDPKQPALYAVQDYAGVVQPHQQLTPWPWGVPHFTPDPELVNRAEWKLLEAGYSFALPAGPGRALDLGAAPGGWSRVLSRAGYQVTAVDPRDLSWQSPQVVHHPTQAESYLSYHTHERFDLITNDMWLTAEESAQIMVRAAPLLKPGGHAILSLKLGNLSEELESRRGPLRRALNLLRQAYRIPRLRQLFYNRNEVTAWLRPCSTGSRSSG
ncbi:MAG: methyltransferase domain-containing protein [Candidatus Eremiobacteraeota bacterium]|nr:methyltransferase domain-containing protein [Candidatus Eremiobacteraeota bacterium]